jgi:hypothetical protein
VKFQRRQDEHLLFKSKILCCSSVWRWLQAEVENGSFTTVFMTAFAVVQDTYDCYSIFDFVVIVDKS